VFSGEVGTQGSGDQGRLALVAFVGSMFLSRCDRPEVEYDNPIGPFFRPNTPARVPFPRCRKVRIVFLSWIELRSVLS